jgi:hypothetical protein
MAELKTYTKLALEPFESYGLTPLTVTAVTDQGCSVSLELCVSPAPSSSAAAEPEGSTRNVLYLLILQVVRELPRLHHVKHLRKEMNTHVKSVRLNPPYQGCYRPVRALVSATLESTVSKKKLVFSCHMSLAHPFNYSQLKKTTQPHGEKVVLKFSGDGTAFSSTSSFVFLSFSFPTLAPDALAASGITIYI